MSILNKLTEGIVSRDLSKEGSALLAKWERTGLLEGLESDRTRANMARLLENQAKELLRENSQMAQGDVEGFAAVAFPIVRRVFGGLIANDLVSVQPMSLPSGLIFFLDFTVSSDTGARLGYESEESLYGGGVVAHQITGGVSLSGDSAEDSFYNLNNGYSSPTSSVTVTLRAVMSGTFGGTGNSQWAAGVGDKLCRYDPDFTSGTTNVAIGAMNLTASAQINMRNLVAVTVTPNSGSQARRLTAVSGTNGGLWQTGDNVDELLFFFHSNTLSITQLSLNAAPGGDAGDNAESLSVAFPIDDDFLAGNPDGIGSVVGDPLWGLENQTTIPEIDIKVDSVAITAITKKLKAKWTPELGQDLNAYHNLDAEVELTSILSEQIALEIDREILEDLVEHAAAGRYYWSRAAGRFVNRLNGQEVGATTSTPDFTGTVSEWYETLIETINDVSAQIHRKTLRGGANFLVCGPEVANILEFTAGFRANITGDDSRGTVGAVKTGATSHAYYLRNRRLRAPQGSHDALR